MVSAKIGPFAPGDQVVENALLVFERLTNSLLVAGHFPGGKGFGEYGFEAHGCKLILNGGWEMGDGRWEMGGRYVALDHYPLSPITYLLKFRIRSNNGGCE